MALTKTFGIACVVASMVLLGGCNGVQTPKTPEQQAFSLYAAYAVAATAERSYVCNAAVVPNPDPCKPNPLADRAVVKQLKSYDEQAYQAIKKVKQAVDSGNPIDALVLAAANEALSLLSSYELSKGIK